VKRKFKRKTSRLAVISFYCAVAPFFLTIAFIFFKFLREHILATIFLVMCILLALAAFILGIAAIIVITARREGLRGYAFAIFAILFAVPFNLITASTLLVALVRAEREKSNTGTYNLRLLGKTLRQYARDHDGFLPPACEWCDKLINYDDNLTRENFKHPKPDRYELKGDCHFALNKNLSGLQLADIQDDVVLLFEADGPWNLNGTSELLQTRYREKGYITMLFADQTTGDYWFYKQAVRKFDSKGKNMYYEQPHW